MRSGLGSCTVRVDGFVPARHDIVVDPVFDIRRPIGSAEDPLVIGVVIGEQRGRITRAIQKIVAQLRVGRGDNRDTVCRLDLL